MRRRAERILRPYIMAIDNFNDLPSLARPRPRPSVPSLGYKAKLQRTAVASENRSKRERGLYEVGTEEQPDRERSGLD